ncbi:MAG: FecR family protein [Leptospira sp.]|nr:FecR family protein [Leptospira sp.]
MDSSQFGKKPIAEVIQSIGQTEVFLHSKKETNWNLAHIGTGLFLRDEAKTDMESKLALRLNNGSELEMSPNSHMLVERVKNESEPDSFFLRKGRLKAIVSKANGSSMKKMLILRTPAAIADVKGTEFITEVDEKENTSLACYEGKVAVSAQNETVEVNAGYATFVEKGKPPMTPFLIPEAPKIQP